MGRLLVVFLLASAAAGVVTWAGGQGDGAGAVPLAVLFTVLVLIVHRKERS